MKLKKSHSESFILELKKVCHQIITETKPKSRANHSLWNDWIHTIIQTCDETFENFKSKAPAQKVSALYNELSRSPDKTEIVCPCCGIYRRHDIQQHLRTSHRLSVPEFKELYAMDVVSGKIKMILSERIKGDKNPAWKHGGKFSPNSNKFIKYTGLSESEKETKLKECRDKIGYSNRERGNNTTTLKYWLKRGYSLDEAKQKLKERQRTFTLEKCIERYGIEEGTKRFLDRQERWQKNFPKQNYSKISQKMFWAIADRLQSLESIKFATLTCDKRKSSDETNYEHRLRLKNKIVLPDFIDLNSGKIIEFDGDYWHGKPGNIKRDAKRDKAIREAGYEVIHIKESEFKLDPDGTINKCIQFLNE